MFPCGQYVRRSSPDTASVGGDEETRFSVKRDESGASTPWIPVDPTQPDLKQFPRFRHARPLRVTVERGDVLYLPALWYHRVSQTASEDPACPYAIAVNVSGRRRSCTKSGDGANAAHANSVVVRPRLREPDVDTGEHSPQDDTRGGWDCRGVVAALYSTGTPSSSWYREGRARHF